MLPGADRLAYLDLDDTVGRPTASPSRAPAGYAAVNGLNVLLATLSTSGSVPVIGQ